MSSASYSAWSEPRRVSAEPYPVGVPAHLELLEPLGRGGMGVVWKARDRGQGRLVAMKTVQARSGEAMVELKREFRAARQVVHPNLVALHELYAEGQQALFTMELVVGEPLAHMPMDPEGLRRSFGALCAALSTLHAAGLVHGDVKSSNVLVQADGRVVLLDLGLSREAGEAVPMRGDGLGPVGTLGTLAPELYAGAPVGPQTDAYALGALLYRCLCRHEATRGDPDTRRWQAEGAWFPSPAELRASVPADLSDLAMRLLDPDPGRRACIREAAEVFAAPVPALRALWIERPDATEALRGAWAMAQTRGATALVQGPGGVGKSSLVRLVVESLGVASCWGCASPVEHLAYQALDSALDALWTQPSLSSAPADALEHASLLFRRLGVDPEQTPLTAGEAAAAVRGLGALLGHVAHEQGLVLIVDDLQWADPDSLRVLASLLRAPRPGCLVVLIARPEGAAQARALAPEGLIELRLAPLSLARVHAGLGEDVALLERLQEAEGGILPASLTLLRADGAPGTELSARLEALLGRLSEAERGALECCCLSARPLSPRVLPELGAGEAAGRALVAAGLLSVRNDAEGGATLMPVHDLVRERVVEGAGLKALHRRLGEHFARGGPPTAGACAHHFVQAGAAEPALTALDTAARYALSQGAFDWSARLFDQAASLGAPAPRLAEPWGMALASGGRHRAAIEVWLRGARGCGGLERVRLLADAADLLMGGGHLDEGLAALDELMTEAGERLQVGGLSALGFVLNTLHAAWRTRRPGAMPPDEAQAVKLEALWAAANSLTPFDPVAGQSIHARHRALSFAYGDARHRAQALGSQLLFRRGQHWSIDRELRLLRDLELWVGDGVRGYVHGCRGYGLRLACDFAASVEVLQHALAFFGEQRQRFWYSRFGQVALLLNDAYEAPLAELDARASATLEDAGARHDKAARVGLDLSITWLVRLLAHDDPDGARAVLEALPGLWGRALQPEQELRRAIAEVQLMLYAGELDRARAALERPAPAVRRLWRFKLIPFYWHLCRGRLGLMADEPDAAVQRCVRALEALGEPVAQGAAGLLRVGLAERRGEPAEAERARARRRLAAQRHSLFAFTLDEDALERLSAHGVRNPERARRWLSGRPT
ncbi:MAG: AAA family ATPase [Alphaproteobacteria bacterium]|nr:AAA family ATPase [Alphaproteobacteria bacterium]